MTKEEYLKRVIKNIPDAIVIDEQSRIKTSNNWSITHYNNKSFSFFRYYFVDKEPQLSVNFIGEFEDWDEDTIDELCKEYIDSYNKVTLMVKKYKLKHELEKIEGDFND